ncbi:GNAT family N-acetyltransferase [Saccharopolyspora shandongensis]|uniref:GNAT family N-acetyltransferase n=1 Tax=Saccharopolyspora shandongensis TaxID=418495 RepID=UPI00340AAC71
MTTTIEPTSPDSTPAQMLLQALHTEQMELYGHADPAEAVIAEFTPPHGVFLLAYLEKEPVGCGGIRTFAPGVAEVRKMFVRPDRRGSGIGRRILADLEKFAADPELIGANRIRLETGIRNTSAIDLYDSSGYVAIDSYVPGRTEVNVAREKQIG